MSAMQKVCIRAKNSTLHFSSPPSFSDSQAGQLLKSPRESRPASSRPDGRSSSSRSGGRFARRRRQIVEDFHHEKGGCVRGEISRRGGRRRNGKKSRTENRFRHFMRPFARRLFVPDSGGGGPLARTPEQIFGRGRVWYSEKESSPKGRGQHPSCFFHNQMSPGRW